MKIKFIGILGIILLSGCTSWFVPEEASLKVSNEVILSDAFVSLMESGKTSREEEQGFIRAARRSFHSINNSLNNAPLPKDIEKWFEENKENIPE